MGKGGSGPLRQGAGRDVRRRPRRARRDVRQSGWCKCRAASHGPWVSRRPASPARPRRDRRIAGPSQAGHARRAPPSGATWAGWRRVRPGFPAPRDGSIAASSVRASASNGTSLRRPRPGIVGQRHNGPGALRTLPQRMGFGNATYRSGTRPVASVCCKPAAEAVPARLIGTTDGRIAFCTPIMELRTPFLHAATSRERRGYRAAGVRPTPRSNVSNDAMTPAGLSESTVCWRSQRPSWCGQPAPPRRGRVSRQTGTF